MEQKQGLLGEILAAVPCSVFEPKNREHGEDLGRVSGQISGLVLQKLFSVFGSRKVEDGSGSGALCSLLCFGGYEQGRYAVPCVGVSV